MDNWAGNYTFKGRILAPTSVDQVRIAIDRSQKIGILGTKHSFNDIADTEGDLLWTQELSQIVSLDRDAQTVTVEAGVKYGDLAVWLEEQGFALANMASLPHISVAGAVATATHGSGVLNGNLSTSVRALEIVRANKDVDILSRDRNPEEFAASVVGLGALGVVTKVTLDILPSYQVRQTVFENLPLETLLENFDAIERSGYSVSLFTRWQGTVVDQVWVKQKAEEPRIGDNLFGAKAADAERHPLPGMPVENCTPQLGVCGSWHERLPHFRMGFTPSGGEELQAEYFVAYDQAPAALRKVAGIQHLIAPILQISEIRTVAADDLWMSMAYGQACVGIHFTWKKLEAQVWEMLPIIEAELAEFDIRPHWGKMFRVPGDLLRQRYPRYGDFCDLAQRHDPDGKFRNAYLDRNLVR